MQFNTGEKFAVIAFPSINVERTLPQVIESGAELFALRALPSGLATHWKEWIGTLKSEALENSDLFIGCKARSNSPQILDHENKELVNKVMALYWGLLFSGWTRIHESPVVLTGAVERNEFAIRQMTTLNAPRFIYGIPMTPNIDVVRIRRAFTLAESLEEIYRTPKSKRFKRVMKAFEKGICSNSAPERIHQFTKCVEGFLLPPISGTKKAFQHRTRTFIGHKSQEIIGEIYDIRSNEEHLHDPIAAIKLNGTENKVVTLLRRAYEIEFIAKYCITHVLENTALWAHFHDDKSLESFWNLPQDKQQAIWGDPADIGAVRGSFNEAGIPQDQKQSAEIEDD